MEKTTAPRNNPQLIIPLTENDLSELQSGEEFNWTFTTDTGVDIDILLKQEEYCDECGEDESQCECNNLP